MMYIAVYTVKEGLDVVSTYKVKAIGMNPQYPKAICQHQIIYNFITVLFSVFTSQIVIVYLTFGRPLLSVETLFLGTEKAALQESTGNHLQFLQHSQ